MYQMFGSKPKLFEQHVEYFREKPGFLYSIEDCGDVKATMNKLFIHIAKRSGYLDSEQYQRKINLIGHDLDEEIRTELRELFRPRNEEFLQYSEFVAGIRQMASSYACRNQRIQQFANEYIQDVIFRAENGSRKKSQNNNLADMRENEFAAHEVIGRGSEIENESNLFRSKSLSAEDLELSSFFIPNKTTEEIFNSCFPELFTEEHLTESMPYHECEPAIRRKYQQMFDYFGEDVRFGHKIDKIVNRASFIRGLCILAENYMKADDFCKTLCVTYIQQKLERVTRKCERTARMSDNMLSFHVGEKVFYRHHAYQAEMPATICGIVNTPQHIDTVYRITLDLDVSKNEEEVYVYSLRKRTAEEAAVDNESAEGHVVTLNGHVTAPTSPYNMDPVVYERDSYDLLKAIERSYGPDFRIPNTEGLGVPSSPGEKYNFWFRIDGIGKVDFDFIQFDYGVKFVQADASNNFLPLQTIDPLVFDHSRLEDSACAQETNRCFFLHLGVGIGMHPLAFQIAYRKYATLKIANSEPDDICVMASQSVLDRDEFVDCMALASLWPKEFDEYQILIVNLDRDGLFNQQQGFTHMRAPIERLIDRSGGKDAWLGKDIVVTLQCGHFTFLKPTGENIIDHPVDTMLEYARKGGFQIASPMDFFFQMDEERISLVELLAEFLRTNSYK